MKKKQKGGVFYGNLVIVVFNEINDIIIPYIDEITDKDNIDDDETIPLLTEIKDNDKFIKNILLFLNCIICHIVHLSMDPTSFKYYLLNFINSIINIMIQFFTTDEKYIDKIEIPCLQSFRDILIILKKKFVNVKTIDDLKNLTRKNNLQLNLLLVRLRQRFQGFANTVSTGIKNSHNKLQYNMANRYEKINGGKRKKRIKKYKAGVDLPKIPIQLLVETYKTIKGYSYEKINEEIITNQNIIFKLLFILKLFINFVFKIMFNIKSYFYKILELIDTIVSCIICFRVLEFNEDTKNAIRDKIIASMLNKTLKNHPNLKRSIQSIIYLILDSGSSCEIK